VRAGWRGVGAPAVQDPRGGGTRVVAHHGSILSQNRTRKTSRPRRSEGGRGQGPLPRWRRIDGAGLEVGLRLTWCAARVGRRAALGWMTLQRAAQTADRRRAFPTTAGRNPQGAVSFPATKVFFFLIQIVECAGGWVARENAAAGNRETKHRALPGKMGPRRTCSRSSRWMRGWAGLARIWWRTTARAKALVRRRLQLKRPVRGPEVGPLASPPCEHGTPRGAWCGRGGAEAGRAGGAAPSGRE